MRYILNTLANRVTCRFANLTQASQMIDYISMCWIYLYFYRAMKTQGYDRNKLPYKGWGQPYMAWFGLTAMVFTVGCYGYTTFLPGCKYPFPNWPNISSLTTLLGWDLGTFWSYYTMCFFCPVIYLGWKIIKRTKIVKPEEADLVWERPIIDAYEANMGQDELSLWKEFLLMLGIGKRKRVEDVE